MKCRILAVAAAVCIGLCSCKSNSIYPLDTDTVLTYYTGVQIGDEFLHELEKQTGVKLSMIYAPKEYNSSIDVLIASGNLPDLIESSFSHSSFSIHSLIDNNIILPLNQFLEEASPNLKAYMELHPDIASQLCTYEGEYYMYPFIHTDPKLQYTVGLMIREDWLNELDLLKPTTIEEWTTVLRAFKYEKNAEIPLINFFDEQYNLFCGAFGTQCGFFRDDNTIVYGPLKSGFADFLKVMSSWYAEGLIDSNLITDKEVAMQSILSGKSGAIEGYAGSSMNHLNYHLGKTSETAKMVCTTNPAPKRGALPQFGHYSGDVDATGGVVISASCKTPELAARFLDYGYSEEGMLLYNFGIQGVSYTMPYGKPVYTEQILNNPTDSIYTNMRRYIRANTNGPFIQMSEYIRQYYLTPEQTDASIVWSNSNAKAHSIPLLSFTDEEYALKQSLEGKIRDYTNDMLRRFIIGVTPLNEYDAFCSELKRLGIAQLTQIYQTAYDRYATAGQK